MRPLHLPSFKHTVTFDSSTVCAHTHTHRCTTTIALPAQTPYYMRHVATSDRMASWLTRNNMRQLNRSLHLAFALALLYVALPSPLALDRAAWHGLALPCLALRHAKPSGMTLSSCVFLELGEWPPYLIAPNESQATLGRAPCYLRPLRKRSSRGPGIYYSFV